MKQLGKIPRVRTALFVDDEIGKGITALSLFRLLNDALQKQGKERIQTYCIIAENQGFLPPPQEPAIIFMPFDQEIEGYNNVIFYATPPSLEEPIIRVLGDDGSFAFHKRCNLLLGLPIKDYNNGKPVFTDRYLHTIQQHIVRFPDIQKEYRKFLSQSAALCLQPNGER